MSDPEILLKRYLELERLLNIFCSYFNFCLPMCIEKELEKAPIAVGCCKNRYYCKYDLEIPSYELLKKEREKIFGPPEKYAHIETLSPCEYHTAQGCVLATHKSPICNAFFCPEAIDFLRENYDIFNYDYLGIYYALEWTLDGTFNEMQYNDFRNELIEINEKIKKGITKPQ